MGPRWCTLLALTLILVTQVLLGDGLFTTQNCRIHWIAHNLHVPGCRDKRLLSLACKGRCESYAMYRPETNKPHRMCKCCQATGSSVRRVRMLCADEPTRHFRPKLIHVALPTGCMCRPCSTSDDRVPDIVNPIEDRTISDYAVA